MALQRPSAEVKSATRKSGSRSRWRGLRWLGLCVLAIVLIVGPAVPASAHVGVFIGGAFGVPVYPYAYTYPYPYAYAQPYPYAYGYPYPYYPPPYVGFGFAVRPGWGGGHWPHGHFGHRGVWAPSHHH